MENTSSVSLDDVIADYNKSFQDKKFGGPGSIHGWILDLLDVKPGRTLLDIGCGQGLLLREADKRGLKTWGIDIAGEACDISRINSPNSEIICGNAQILPWQGDFFDYITNIGSLEHFLDPESSLIHMRRTLKQDGRAALMLPNLYYYRYLLDRFFKGKEPTSYQLIERFAKRKVWQDLLERNGFKITRIHKYNKLNRSKLMVWIRNVLIPLDFSHHFVFILSKR